MGLLAAIAALGLDYNLLHQPGAAYAQPTNQSPLETRRTPGNQAISVILDVDPGVDDASALVWLLTQTLYPVNILGICTVAGNTSLENATNNVLTVLDVVAPDSRIPVIMGAEKPLTGELSRLTKLIHGPDGLWGAQRSHHLERVQKNAPMFYYAMAEARPGFTVVALGPLTNLAQTLQRFPQAAQGIGRIVWLGGAKSGGNHTVVSEFNAWQDPEAAHIVLSSGIPVTVMPLDTFTQLAITAEDVQALEHGNAGGRFLMQPLRDLLRVFQQLIGIEYAVLPDLVTMMVALDPSLARTQPALVKIVTDQSLARGQTVTALNFLEHLVLVGSDAELSALVDRFFSEPSFDLFRAFHQIVEREPMNVQWVSDINEKAIHDRFMRALTS
jgi:inosine-uridine nucleoside N-ribohydrolase